MILLFLLMAASVFAPVFANDDWHSGLQGDPRSVGRGGTGVVLSDDLWGVFENPAGSALTVPGTQLQYSKNKIQDTQTLVAGRELQFFSAGLVAPETPWGFSAGLSESSQAEAVREYSVSASRLFLNEHLSLGASLNYGYSVSADRMLVYQSAWGATLGGMYRFPKRFLVGMSYRSAMGYSKSDGGAFLHPWNFEMGLGQIPNRFFRAELGVRFIGASEPGVFSIHAQPHLGFEYEFINLRQIQIRLYSGSYLENSRLHGTFGFGLDPWLFSVGASVDVASGYRNYLFAVGLDVGRTLKRLRVAPSTVSAPPGGVFPSPLEVNEDWLPPRLQDDPENSFQDIGPSPDRIKKRIENMDQIIKDQPKAIEDEAGAFLQDWNDLTGD
ncbi:hypothetical protein WDW37_01970 [Bdellovibrionota bacterium FG-1]